MAPLKDGRPIPILGLSPFNTASSDDPMARAIANVVAKIGQPKQATSTTPTESTTHATLDSTNPVYNISFLSDGEKREFHAIRNPYIDDARLYEGLFDKMLRLRKQKPVHPVPPDKDHELIPLETNEDNIILAILAGVSLSVQESSQKFINYLEPRSFSDKVKGNVQLAQRVYGSATRMQLGGASIAELARYSQKRPDATYIAQALTFTAESHRYAEMGNPKIKEELIAEGDSDPEVNAKIAAVASMIGVSLLEIPATKIRAYATAHPSPAMARATKRALEAKYAIQTALGVAQDIIVNPQHTDFPQIKAVVEAWLTTNPTYILFALGVNTIYPTRRLYRGAHGHRMHDEHGQFYQTLRDSVYRFAGRLPESAGVITMAEANVIVRHDPKDTVVEQLDEEVLRDKARQLQTLSQEREYSAPDGITWQGIDPPTHATVSLKGKIAETLAFNFSWGESEEALRIKLAINFKQRVAEWSMIEGFNETSESIKLFNLLKRNANVMLDRLIKIEEEKRKAAQQKDSITVYLRPAGPLQPPRAPRATRPDSEDEEEQVYQTTPANQMRLAVTSFAVDRYDGLPQHVCDQLDATVTAINRGVTRGYKRLTTPVLDDMEVYQARSGDYRLIFVPQAVSGENGTRARELLFLKGCNKQDLTSPKYMRQLFKQIAALTFEPVEK